MGTDVTGFRLKRTLSNELGLYQIRETHTILGSGLSMTLQGARGRTTPLGGPQWVPACLFYVQSEPGRNIGLQLGLGVFCMIKLKQTYQ
jgi:hypothetical protein